MGAQPIDLSAGFVQKPPQPIDLSAGFVQKADAPAQAPLKPVEGKLEANTPSLLDRARGVIANSAIGHSLESALPKVADALHLHPSETVNSPTYQSDKTQIIAPQYAVDTPSQDLAPNDPAVRLSHLKKGVAQGVGQLTSGKNLATAAGIAATGGILAPLAPAAGATGVAATAARLVPQATRVGIAGLGVKGIADDARAAHDQYKAGDTNAALESAGAAIPNAAFTLPMFGEPMKALGDAAEKAGTEVINKTVGAQSSDFKRGTDPGRGYFEAGNGPSTSMKSIADKAVKSKTAVGQQMGSMRSAASTGGTLIPIESIAEALHTPLNKARELETGPGGVSNTAAIDAYANNLLPMLQQAKQNGGLTPDELFDLKRSIAQNTNWSDPTQFNLKAVRQQQAGALGGLLNESIPGYSDLAGQYADLGRMAARAQASGDATSSALAQVASDAHVTVPGLVKSALKSVPVQTTVASGLRYGGKGLGWLGELMTPRTAGSEAPEATPAASSAPVAPPTRPPAYFPFPQPAEPVAAKPASLLRLPWEAQASAQPVENPRIEGGGGQTPEHSEAGASATPAPETSKAAAEPEVAIPSRLPDPHDDAAWEKLWDEGMAQPNLHTGEWEYTGPIRSSKSKS